MRRLAYLIKEALTSIRVNRTTTLVAVATTSFTLAIFGLFLLLYVNVRSAAGSLEEEIKVMVYLQDDVSPQAVGELQGRLKREPEIATVVHVSKQQALADFRAQFPDEYDLLQGLGDNPLPASFVVTMAVGHRDPESVKRWVNRHKTLPGVAEVQYSREWIENLSTLVGYLELTAFAIGSLLAVATVTIIASTIRLTLYARRDEIEIMRLIGATSRFIKFPYLLEGGLLGTLGGVLSLGVLRGGYEVFQYRIGSGRGVIGAGLDFLPDSISVLLVLLGLALGVIGSYVSLVELRGMRS